MREILFRGKREIDDEWIYGLYLDDYVYDTDFPCIIPLRSGNHYLDWAVIRETVGQYTGLKDKNGKRIFEGDILSYDKKCGVVKFDNGCYVFWWKRFDKYSPDFFKKCILTNYGSFENLEVIGNIHDNPELLEVSM